MSIQQCPTCGRRYAGAATCQSCGAQLVKADAEGREVIVKKYKGGQRQLANTFRSDAARFAAQGYVVESQTTIPGHKTWTTGWGMAPADEMLVTYRRKPSGPPTMAMPPAAPDKYEQLRRLHELKKAGALTEEEFQQEKAKMLNKD